MTYKPGKTERLAIRVGAEEKARLQEVVERVCRDNPHMDMTKVMRELIGFDKRRFVKDEDVAYLDSESRPNQKTKRPEQARASNGAYSNGKK